MRSLWLPLLAVFFLTGVLGGCAATPQGTAGTPASRKGLADAKEKLGISLIQAGQNQKGLKELLEASDLDPGNAAIHNSIGLAYRNLGELEKAITHFQRAMALDEDFPDAMNNLGTVFARLRRWNEAAALFERASGYDAYDRRHKVFENLGSVSYYRGRYAEAVHHYQKAVALAPDYGSAHVNLGAAYERMENPNGAVLAYRRAIAINPADARARLLIARLFLKLGRYQEAEGQVQRVLEDNPGGIFAEEGGRLLTEIRKGRDDASMR